MLSRSNNKEWLGGPCWVIECESSVGIGDLCLIDVLWSSCLPNATVRIESRLADEVRYCVHAQVGRRNENVDVRVPIGEGQCMRTKCELLIPPTSLGGFEASSFIGAEGAAVNRAAAAIGLVLACLVLSRQQSRLCRMCSYSEVLPVPCLQEAGMTLESAALGRLLGLPQLCSFEVADRWARSRLGATVK